MLANYRAFYKKKVISTFEKIPSITCNIFFSYKASDSTSQTCIKEFMSNWLQIHVRSRIGEDNFIFFLNFQMNEKSFILRKAAQLFALVAVIDFPLRWKTFFSDLIATCKWSDANVDFYLKVLLAIDIEVVDREIPHTLEVR